MSKLPCGLDKDYAPYIQALQREVLQAQADAQRQQHLDQYGLRACAFACACTFAFSFLLVFLLENILAGTF
jgi:hypothetical protein